MRYIGISALALASMFGTGVAGAQSSGPSAQQIIQALKPSGNVSATTRGIVPLGSGSAPAASQSGTQAKPSAMRVGGSRAARHPALGTPSINLNIDFQLGSAALTPRAKTELDRLGKALTDPTLANYHFRLVGHTDTTGAAATNLSLSQARAAAVAQYLTAKFGIAPARLAASGVGERDLLVPTGPNVASQANRRVQVINIGK